MAIITQTDLQERIGAEALVALTDRKNFGEVDASRVTDVLAVVEDEISSRIKARYAAVPDPAPERIKRVAVDLALYFLYSDSPTTVSEGVRQRFEDGQKYLDRIAKGQVQLTGATELSPAGSQTTQGTSTTGRVRQFGADDMEDW